MTKENNKKKVQFSFDPKTGQIIKPKEKPKPIVDPRNKLNDLTGGEWIQFTTSLSAMTIRQKL